MAEEGQEESAGDGVVDGCVTTATFGLIGDAPKSEEIHEPLEDELVCGDTRVYPDIEYLRERLIGLVTDEVCQGTFYHSSDLDGIAGVCCPAGKICDYNCDYQVTTLDLLLLEQILQGEVGVELPGDGIDNTCDGQVDCGETVEGYCPLPSCETAFQTQSMLEDT